MSDPARIVAIDDEREFIRTLDEFFTARGHEVHVAMTGVTGLQLIDSCNPDVVIVDLKMPGMDGDEVLRRVRERHPGTKVIVITAYNDGGKTRDRLLAEGAYAHFDKPLSSLRDLAQTIRAAKAASP
jgi:CheY-like chemotaxis protein